MSRTDNALISNNTEITKHHIYFMVFVSVLTISLMSKSSFLYPLNDWVDSNCFFTVGKALLSGKVLYRDIFEQKGPLIYFLHALAARISYRSFLGMYFFEIFACFIFLYYSAKLFALFSDSGAKRGSLFSGDSAERFSLFSGDSAKRVSGADCIYYFIPVVSALTYQKQKLIERIQKKVITAAVICCSSASISRRAQCQKESDPLKKKTFQTLQDRQSQVLSAPWHCPEQFS